MLNPTAELLRIAEGKNVHYTFFVDVGYLIASEEVEALNSERKLVLDQMSLILEKGHDVQLHIHPHWERSTYENGQWNLMSLEYYRLNNFELDEAKEIVRKYKRKLEEYIGREVTAYRAGGWCIQPFEPLAETFQELGLKADSSVIPGFRLVTDQYAIDFSTVLTNNRYSFSTDVCLDDPNGSMTEYPIMSYRYSPLFFWNLYLKGRLKPEDHKMVGDGNFISHGSKKWEQLLSYTTGHLSTDGFYASKLEEGLEKAFNLDLEDLVIIGHPKGNTRFSVRKLEEFIKKNCEKHQFRSFRDIL